MDINAAPEQTSYNNPLYGQFAAFTLPEDAFVPYFSSVMPIERVNNELRTHEQVPPSLDTNYSLRELYQREINHDRVRQEIVNGFLADPIKLKFFNSLTIVLLPKDSEGHICSEFSSYAGNDPAIPYSESDTWDAQFRAANKRVFGGVQLAIGVSGIARLRWDSTRVEAVAVDGQHRLAAIQLWIQDNKNNSLTRAESETRVPVLFLLLDKRAGFKLPAATREQSIKWVAREIFTDLNKHAQKVDKAREIILDDRSLQALCVRELVTETTGTDSEERLPLSLIRWKEPNHRFDQEYFLNSLIHLYLLVGDILELDEPSDPMDSEAVLDFVQRCQAALGSESHDGRLLLDGVSLERYVRERYFEEGELAVPLSAMPTAYLPAAVQEFRKRYIPWLVTLLTKAKPYAELLSYARKHSLLTGPFAAWHAQPGGHQPKLAREMEAKHGVNWKYEQIDKHIAAIEEIKGTPNNENWMFKSIFQKAVAKVAKRISLSWKHEEERFGTISRFVSFIDSLYDAGLLKVQADLPDEPLRLWSFVGLNPLSGTIKVSKKIESNIQSVLTLAYICYSYCKVTERTLRLEPADDSETVESLITTLGRADQQSDWPVNQDIKSLHEVFHKGAHAAKGKPAAEVSDGVRGTFAKQRLIAVLKRLLDPFTDKSTLPAKV